MKNTITVIYITIISILIVTVFFTIAELNLVTKTAFTNHLEQSVVMTASYLILCKLIVQMAITYLLGNILYNKMKSTYKIVDTKRGTWQSEVKANTQSIKKTIQDDISSVVEGVKRNIILEPIISNEDFDRVDRRYLTEEEILSGLENECTTAEREDQSVMKSIIDEPINYETLNYPMKLHRLLYNVENDCHTFTSKEREENREWELVGVVNRADNVLTGKRNSNMIGTKDKRYYFDDVLNILG